MPQRKEEDALRRKERGSPSLNMYLPATHVEEEKKIHLN
jgi:hypothetical protein